MKRFLSILALLSVPAVLMFQVWQSYRFIQVADEVAELEEAQQEQMESNKRLLMSIAVYDSPARVLRIAENELGLEPPTPDRVLQVRLAGGEVLP